MGQENAENSSWKNFDLRLYNSDLGRMNTPDPYGQFHSGYVGMGNNPVVFVDPSGGYMKLYSRSSFVNDMMRFWEEWRESVRNEWERWDNFKYNVGFPSGASGGASRGNNSTSYGIDASGQPVDFTQQIKDVINETNGTTAWNLNHVVMTDRSGAISYVSNTVASSATGVYSAGGKTIIKTQGLIVTPNDELTLTGSKSTIYNTSDGVMIDLGTESYWALPYNSGYNASDFGGDGWGTQAQSSGGTDWEAVGNGAFYTEQGLSAVGYAAKSSAAYTPKYAYRGMAQAEAAAAKTLGNIAKTTRVLGVGASLVGGFATVLEFSNSDKSGADYARLTGAGLILGANFIPVVGPFISVGLGALDAYGAFDGIYNSFDTQSTLYPSRR